MSSNLNKLLAEYEIKRNKAISDAEDRKENIFSQNPRLQEIEIELSKYSIEKAKKLLSSNSHDNIKSIDSAINKLKDEKKSILSTLNIDNSYFNPKFECSICSDTGYITENFQTTMCSCLKQKLFDVEFNTFNVYNMQTQTFDSFKSTYYSNTVDKERYNSNISPRENIKLILNICKNFINNFENPEEKNLLFTGNSGLGKTFLSNCIANELLKKEKTVLYQTAPVMLDSIINYRLGKSNSDINIYDHLLDVDLLIIDDLGTENMNNMKFAELFTIINSRLLPQKGKNTKTIISTNLDLKNLANLYGERIISRFAGHYNICYFFGEDIRFIKK